MAGVILDAAMFLGILDGAGMLVAIALQLVEILPATLGPYLHIIIGLFGIIRLFGVPLDLLTFTDAYYFSVLPIFQETVGYSVCPVWERQLRLSSAMWWSRSSRPSHSHCGSLWASPRERIWEPTSKNFSARVGISIVLVCIAWAAGVFV